MIPVLYFPSLWNFLGSKICYLKPELLLGLHYLWKVNLLKSTLTWQLVADCGKCVYQKPYPSVKKAVIFTISSSYRPLTPLMSKYLNNYIQTKMTWFKLPLDFKTKSKYSIIIFTSTSLCLTYSRNVCAFYYYSHLLSGFTLCILCMLLASVMWYFFIIKENGEIITKWWK